MNPLRKLSAIGFNVWRETIRNRGIFTLSVFFILFLFSSHVVGAAAMINSDRIVQTMGAFCFGLFGILSNIYLGNILIQDITKKRLNIILTRPVSRSMFLTGKFFGMALVLATVFGIAAAAWIFLLRINEVTIKPAHGWILIFFYGEWLIIAASSIFFAAFTSPLLHAFFVFFFTFFGHYSWDLVLYSTTQTNIALKQLFVWLYYIIPNLEQINFRKHMLYESPIAVESILSGAGLVLLWVTVLLSGACIIFSKRNI